MEKLKPVRNLKFKQPRVCATCAYLDLIDGSVQCVRPKGPGWDVGDMYHWTYVCDRYKSEDK